MNPQLQSIIEKIQSDNNLTGSEKESYIKSLKEIDKKESQLQFKLERFEKDRHTLSVMLEESIEDLQRKSKTIEQANAELQNKNRELEIESSLERVRSVAMGMKKPDDMLDVCKTIAHQLELLHVKEIRNVQTAIFYEEKGFYTNYEYYARHDKLFVTDTNFRDHSIAEEFANQMMKGPNEVFVHKFTDKEVQDWLSYQKGTNVFIDTYLETASSLNYYWYSLGPVAIGMSTYVPLREDEVELFKRFRNVFELAYRRYLDIETAEAQAKEAKIEAALEKIRSRSLAMHHADELKDVITVVREKLKELDIAMESRTVLILTLKKDSKDFTQWVARPENLEGKSASSCFETPYFDHPIIKDFWNTKESGLNFFSKTYTPSEKNSFFKYLFENTDSRNTSKEEQDWILKPGDYSVSAAIENNSAIIISNFSSKLLSEKESEILKRFAKVFEQAYIRFLDLQKAEAQAREAQIQLALERVRARTMAMQKQNDLLSVLDLLVEQLIKLGVHLEVANFSNKIPGGDWNLWINVVADDGTIYNNYVHFPRIEHPYFNHVEKNIEIFRSAGTDLFKDVFSKEEKDSWQDYVYSKTIYKDIVPQEHKQMMYDKPGYTWSMILLKDTWVSICRFNMIPFSDEEDALFKRFANAFGQAYTRFLDLQKAEEQARESQIQLALERVRARTMAMQHSNELSETTAILFQQMNELGYTPERLGIGIIKEDKGLVETWATEQGGNQINHSFNARLDEPTTIAKLYEGWKSKKASMVVDISGNELKQWIRFLQDKLKMPVKEQLLQDRRVQTVAYFKDGFILITTPEPLPAETISLLERFAEVFNLTYTRFLDLQKAEAQAREAQIQLALERVRARAMAMQTSEELGDLIGTVFAELTKLDLAVTRCTIWIIDAKTNDATWWMANSEDASHPMNYFLPYHAKPPFLAFIKEWKKGTLKWVYDLNGETKKDWDDHLFSNTGLSKMPGFIQAGMRAPERVLLSASFNNFGAINVASLEPFSDEHFDIILRFAKVFDLTYTRFNDLKQAEAQARESQIQLALERVRARTMAMQKSDELAETAVVVFKQMNGLGIIPNRLYIVIINDDSGNMEFWITDENGDKIGSRHPVSIHENISLKAMFEGWTAKKKTLTIDQQGSELQDWLKYWKENFHVSFKDDTIIKRRIQTIAYFSKGFIAMASPDDQPGETIQLLERFAAVFNLTYTRFSDLQQAEAQARESQIQLALERVRARTMAMHDSKELAESAIVLFQQFQELGILTDHARPFFSIFDPEKEITEVWTAKDDGTLRASSHIVSFNENESLKKVYEAWKAKAPYFVRDMRGKELSNYLTYLMKIPHLKEEKILQQLMITPPERIVVTDTFFSQGSIAVISLSPTGDEQKAIMLRFAKVFEQTYTRFLDLQKAEAQAREAQIEASLERVRAKTMAMHKSEDLSEVALALFREVKSFGGNLGTCGFVLCDRNKTDDEYWVCWETGIQSPMLIPHTTDPTCINLYRGWENGAEFYAEEKTGDELKAHFDYMLTVPTARHVFENWLRLEGKFPDWQRWHAAYFKQGFVFVITVGPYPEQEIFKRFAPVFGQAYTRFLDLQKAEAQAREAQIEAALERVRARAMAMHSSEDLNETIKVFYQQVSLLSLTPRRCGVGLINKESRIAEVSVMNTTEHDESVEAIGEIELSGHPVLDAIYEHSLSKQDYFPVLRGNQIKEYYKVVTPYLNYPDYPHDAVQYGYFFFFNEGTLYTWTIEKLPDEELKIYRRFNSVVSLTYKRYKDLKQAEAQARESQIEAALERVRSKTMAMHNSQDIAITVSSMFDEFSKLGIKTYRSGIGIMHETQPMELWTARPGTDGKAALVIGKLDMNIHPLFQGALNGWKDKNETFSYELKGEELIDYYQLLNKQPDYPAKHDLSSLPPELFHNDFYFNEGTLFVFSLEQLPVEASTILKRFSKVFGQTYRRYLDLQKAEAQAREAQIESSLERVRSKTMAMHNSNDVGETVAIMFAEFVHLGIITNRCGILIFNDDHSAEVWTARSTPEGKAKLIIGKLDLGIHQMLSLANKAWKARESFYQYELVGEDLIVYYDTINNAKFYPTQFDLTALPSEEFHTEFFFADGAVFSFTNKPVAEENAKIIKRFASVFGQTYRRYLDLQKAEAQAREAQIEAGLERVRYRAMAMQTSKDVGEATSTMFVELDSLGIETFRCGIAIVYGDEMEVWSMGNTGDGRTVKGVGRISSHLHPLWIFYINEWRKKTEVSYYYLAGKEKEDYVKILTSMPTYNLSDTNLNFPDLHFQGYYFEEGSIFTFSLHPHSEADKQVMKRFANVFALTFRRYRDLERAEAQAREAQIEAALERIRARTMAMQKSDELSETVYVLFQQFKELGENPDQATIGVINENEKLIEYWVTLYGQPINKVFKFSIDEPNVTKKIYKAWKENKRSLVIDLKGKALSEFMTYRAGKGGAAANPDEKRRIINVAFFSKGLLNVQSNEERSEESIKLLERFASVFEQTYTRFLDLQKAEAQAREAQIEAGLERVRARTMAMHSSDDVSAATATMFFELEKLGIENFRGGITNILSNRTQNVWSVSNLAEGKVVKAVGAFNIDAHPLWQLMYKEWETKKEFLHYFLEGQEKEDYLKILNTTQGYLTQAIQFPDVHFQVYFFNEGAVWTNSLQPHSDDDKQIMKRFTSVFSLTFRRYQDLKHAEAQAREAQIEAALERVRAKAMAMQNSNDLSIAASMVFTELRKLGINPIRCGVGILNKESRKAQLYSATSSENGDSLSLVGWVQLENHPVLNKIYDSWVQQHDYFPELQGKQLQSYYKLLLAGLSVPVPDFTNDQKQYGHFVSFSIGCLYAWSDVPYDEEQIKIFKRFATIVDLTFRRYLELQHSEANAREAVKQAALDRVRADIASMRTVADLDRITPLIWNELTILGLPFIRCGVFIVDDSQQLIHTFLSTPDGKAVGAFHLPYDTPGNFAQMVIHWKQKKLYVDHWTESDFISLADVLVKQGAITKREQYLDTLPHGGFYLHFLPFLQGTLYVGNISRLNDEEIKLIQSVADAFSTAYSRYEDFNKLEGAKKQVENTLTDLKQAQTQLVQSEKMASLGELTAGIAHEIQNPLNFVNNFSDVSNELIDEMKQEMETGNWKLANEIAEDVKQNLEKIIHHGKRADAIVKGMLQHSRTSSGQKELTDINALCDEYVRLAYHGLRAKDKSFNAKFETDFDPSIEKINVVPQDIGRVLLNLINNSFYAVNEKQKAESKMQNAESGKFQPSVSIQTKKLNGNIEIRVTDNGNGISQKVLDKIFQPFFTTKPTGQGTGLGLSLSYDIVKAHGGEIKVNTKESEGSEFIIQLPNYSA